MKILSFGEILWDVFEDTSKIGGATLNFSGHLAKLGVQAYIFSAIGKDSLCDKTLKELYKLNVNRKFVTVNPNFFTGKCKVTCNKDGQPSYELLSDTAFDNMNVTDEVIDEINANNFDAFYFGTLIQRSCKSREALKRILSESTFSEIFCDLNLRPDCYSSESIETCLKHCTILKISREEYTNIIQFGFNDICKDDFIDEFDFYKAFSSNLASKYHIKIVIITLDKDGAFVYNSLEDRGHLSIKPKNKALSTVGAGDSFCAVFLYNYLNHQPLSECISKAITLSDYVVTHYEAIPEYTKELYDSIV
jgi:fructokinase